ncbi:hypothetical protein DYB28_012688, partial [Aphanomyces astaci]
MAVACFCSSLENFRRSDEQKHATAISVYQRLHTFKFKPHVSLDVILQAFDKMQTAVEKLEGQPLSDSHLASTLVAALPDIPYKNMRQLLEQHWPGLVTKYSHFLGPAPIAAAAPVHDSLLEQHWPGLVTKYSHFLGPAPIAAAAPVHDSATATATTRSSALGYGQAATVPWGTQGQDPMAD